MPSALPSNTSEAQMQNEKEMLSRLEQDFKNEWAMLASIKKQDEYIRARAEALKKYQNLKKTKQFLNLL